MNINCLVEKMSLNSNFLNDIVNDLIENPDLLDYSNIKEYNKYSGVLKAEVLEKFLKKMNRKKKIILPKIISFSDKTTITDENFKTLLKLNKKLRNTVLISLAHCDISIYQLLFINNLGICVEAFCKLLFVYSYENCFSSEDLKKMINDSTNIKNKNIFVKSFLESNKQTLTENKIKVLNSFSN